MIVVKQQEKLEANDVRHSRKGPTAGKARRENKRMLLYNFYEKRASFVCLCKYKYMRFFNSYFAIKNLYTENSVRRITVYFDYNNLLR